MRNFIRKYKGHYIKTLQLAYPVCISNVGYILVGIVDTYYVGKISADKFSYTGTEAQAAVGLSESLYNLFIVLAIGISYGITPLIAAADSRKNSEEKKKLLGNSMMLNLLVSVLLFILLFFSSSLLNYINQPPGVLKLAVPYFNVVAFSLIPLSIFFTLKQFTEGLSLTFMAMIASVSGNVLNIVLNYALVLGNFGFEPMGVMGSCWSAFIARSYMAFFMLGYIYFSKDLKGYFSFLFPSRPDYKKIISLLEIGLATGLQWLFEIGAFSIAVIMMGWLGDSYQAAHRIALSFPAVTYMISSGISAAASVRVGNYNGLNKRIQLRRAGYSAFHLTGMFMIFFTVLFIVFNRFFVSFFSSDEQVVSIASGLLLIASFFQLGDGIQVIALGILRGVKDTRFPTVLTLIAYWGISLPLSYFLAFKMNMHAKGIWYGLTTGLYVAAVFLFFRFLYVTGKNKQGVFRSALF